jgi:PAS domain S-box-containing protein
MSRVRTVDLHTHSHFSDGTLSPEQLAGELVRAGVRHAALTDHNTLEGLERFRAALEPSGVHVVSGVEIDALAAEGVLHVLAFHFHEQDPDLRQALDSIRHPHVALVAGALRGGQRPGAVPVGPGQGALPLDEVCRLVHAAGGVVVAAHPLAGLSGLAELELRLPAWKAAGLDGLEAHYKDYDGPTRAALRELAARHGLLACAGSDFHGPGSGLGPDAPGMEIPEEDWLPLARRLGWAGREFLRDGRGRRRGEGGRNWRGFLLHIGLPAGLAGLLFLWAIFGVLIPTMEEQLLERKKETIRELTRTASSILQEYADDAAAGHLPEDRARSEAAGRIRRMRYGPEGKDYFWITDLRPVMIMHPWRTDLDGRDVSGFVDPHGRRVFVEFVKAVENRESGYVEYDWQWKDDPDQIVPKLSYVQAFRPWGWVIGTGIYTQDVQAEISRVRTRLVWISLAIALAVGMLLLYAMRQSLLLETRRARAERELTESREKYRSLAEAGSEGMLMVLDGDVSYANRPMELLCGSPTGGLAGRHALDLLPEESAADRRAREWLRALLEGGAAAPSLETRLRGLDGSLPEVLLSATPIAFDGRRGFILVARDIGRHKELADALRRSRTHYRKLTRAIRLGVFRSGWEDGAPLLEANPAMRRLLGLSSETPLEGLDWLERVADDEARQELRGRLEREESVEVPRLALLRPDGSRTEARLFAVLVREDGRVLCDGVLEDLSDQLRADARRDELIGQLQSTLFYLQEPVAPAVRPAPTLPPGRSIAEAARRMGLADSSALVVVTEAGEPVGLVTDRDFRARVTAGQLDPSRPVREIMSAPLATISVHALVHEAIMQMQNRRIGHLVALDDAGRLAGLLRDRNLVHFRHYSTVILTHSLRHAAGPAELAEAASRLPRLVHALLGSGTRVRAVNRLVSSAADAAVERLLELALDEMGPPPLPFAFLAMGSEGRMEQTLLTDQDNGIIYEDPPAGREEECAAWFLELGRRVCAGLAAAGYRECPGGVMASRTRWNHSLSGWKAAFSGWIREAGPQELLDLNIAFDFRAVAGSGGEAPVTLARHLRAHVTEEIRHHPPFLPHLAQNALLAKPGLGLRGNILLPVTTPGGVRALDLKEALLPLVNTGRLYALRHELMETHTLDRLARLHELGRLGRELHENLAADYETVQRLRLARQAQALLEGRDPLNSSTPADWSAADEAALKRLLGAWNDLRKKIGYDFLGMA